MSLTDAPRARFKFGFGSAAANDFLSQSREIHQITLHSLRHGALSEQPNGRENMTQINLVQYFLNRVKITRADLYLITGLPDPVQVGTFGQNT
ncbi:hypothetical protein [Tichowtungia aerotolerans]|uniref:Uncharacterized protein n=1 Tax=Tichowtungia aerotolerans TaxID=2697043 RepID=A0A6P1M072_9BACT|nr:hypothetical protein [Tichowtungia aerotolerans]QHI67950.1 hypothetical protein GT409_00300 [Tichowtungia aerotolerans]